MFNHVENEFCKYSYASSLPAHVRKLVGLSMQKFYVSIYNLLLYTKIVRVYVWVFISSCMYILLINNQNSFSLFNNHILFTYKKNILAFWYDLVSVIVHEHVCPLTIRWPLHEVAAISFDIFIRRLLNNYSQNTIQLSIVLIDL